MKPGHGLALALLFAAAGCHDPRTEVVGIVSTSGVRIPDDVDTIHVAITSKESGSSRWDADYRLCTAGESSASGTCYDVPFTMTLIPGSHSPGDAVRVQVDAKRGGTPVISDAALFTFTPGKSLRLDFVLYANCLGNVMCATRDEVCGPDASCMPIMPTPLSGEPDLSATPPDLSVPPPDLLSPPDLTGVDLKGCVPSCIGRFCGSDGCGGFCQPGCNLPATCNDTLGQCVAPLDMAQCVPQCGNKQCGPDNCGHPNGCGVCASGSCDPSGQCVIIPTLDMSTPPDMDMSVPPSDMGGEMGTLGDLL